ncbi:hypothetical protein LSH36_795g00049 [Paralvinella palmiformis]|uniref:Uncharacterized protein n=1 Tax=Paralvinella palmiformis TaxID=53620 RepID=A0AAD9J0H1_9ANNE|nr:hypothetical protein LSH36_795g00049 [Paralvinella palmiformis]
MAAKTSDEEFRIECKSLLEDLKRKCDELQNISSLPETSSTLDHCKMTLKSVENVPELSSGESLQKWLKELTKVLLDLTHVEENILVDDGFHAVNSIPRMKDILKVLDIPLRLNVGKNNILEVLGEELVECIHWRIGALCYMYCATLAQDENRQEEIGEDFINIARNGVSYLSRMLATRKCLTEDMSDVSVICEDVYHLLKMGAYSDTHVLAVMYIGELCYWFLKYGHSTDENEKSYMRNVGRKQLRLYIKLTDSYLHGWDSTRAKELLSLL